MSQHIHILGICGTFMGGMALLARELGFRVTGADENVYPPMSTQLTEAGIVLSEGYRAEDLSPAPDLVVIGNALSRGNPAVEAVLNQGLPYVSGPQWLGETLLKGRWVLAVSGTHGKTTTTSMLAWILEFAGYSPGFLVGGVPVNFGLSARIGDGDFFVVEADEYDTAFFDKRSKFVHYRPRSLIINNLEYDHADIFPDLAAIETQFHHLIRCVPGSGQVIRGEGESIDRVLDRGCWTPVSCFGSEEDSDWSVRALDGAGQVFKLESPRGERVEVAWSLLGEHNLLNACAAVAAAHSVGVPLSVSADALAGFRGVKRRLELLDEIDGVRVYDDFAHHPTAIATTLEGLARRRDQGRLIAVIEPRSNTMRAGVHVDQLAAATASADRVFWFEPPGLNWSIERMARSDVVEASSHDDLAALTQAVVDAVRPGDTVVVMSNGGFGGFHKRLLEALKKR